jgi:hypothetical protein
MPQTLFLPPPIITVVTMTAASWLPQTDSVPPLFANTGVIDTAEEKWVARAVGIVQ